MKRHVTHQEIATRAGEVARRLLPYAHQLMRRPRFFGVPRGGIPALYAVLDAYNQTLLVRVTRELTPLIVDQAENADFIIDDLIDSGETAARMSTLAPTARFFALITKGKTEGYPLGEWLVFPWEESEEKSIDDAFTRIFQFIGENPERGGLVETPARMAKAWQHWTKGYKEDPIAILKTFEDGAEVYDELVHVGYIPFYSQCEHHLAPIFGEAFFGYIPNKRIVGLSKMSRLIDCFARRLQVQERLTAQVIDAFCNHVEPLGAGIVVRARHLCMESRGVCQQGVITTTSAFRGVIKKDPAARAEFFSITNAPKL